MPVGTPEEALADALGEHRTMAMLQGWTPDHCWDDFDDPFLGHVTGCVTDPLVGMLAALRRGGWTIVRTDAEPPRSEP